MPYDFFDLRFFIDTASIIFDGLRGIGGKKKAEKLMDDLKPFVGRRVIFRTGKIRGGKFRVKETYQLESCMIKLEDDTIYIYIYKNGYDILREFISGSTISKYYTGMKNDNRMLINTSDTDYLLDLVTESEEQAVTE